MRLDHPGRSNRTISLHYRVLAVAVLMVTAVLATTVANGGVFEADDQGAPLSKLITFNDVPYTVTYSDGVSQEALTSTIVRKVGYGHVTNVKIVTTESGTYSSDGLISPHVLYPGITVERANGLLDAVQPQFFSSGPGFAILQLGRNPVGGHHVHSLTTQSGSSICTAGQGVVSCARY